MRWRVALVAALVRNRIDGRAARATRRRHIAMHLHCVGHGGGELLELPDGRTILYDAGRLGSPWGAARSISAYFWSRGITHLDAVVISHADTDHYNAMPELLERFSVGVVYVSPVMFKKPAGGLKVLLDSLAAVGNSTGIHSGGRSAACGRR